MTLHVCPVCEQTHTVTPARHSVAWGRQLTCSCACELERRRRVRRRLREAYESACGGGRGYYSETMRANDNRPARDTPLEPVGTKAMTDG